MRIGLQSGKIIESLARKYPFWNDVSDTMLRNISDLKAVPSVKMSWEGYRQTVELQMAFAGAIGGVAGGVLGGAAAGPVGAIKGCTIGTTAGLIGRFALSAINRSVVQLPVAVGMVSYQRFRLNFQNP